MAVDMLLEDGCCCIDLHRCRDEKCETCKTYLSYHKETTKFGHRTSKDQWFLDLALRCSYQGTCLRRNVGAVVVNLDGYVISTGYTGAPRKIIDCQSTGNCIRQELNVPSGQRYELCCSVHAEQNALIQAGKDAKGSIIYIAGYDVETGGMILPQPCFMCAKLIVNAQIAQVVVAYKQKIYKCDPYDVYLARFQEVFGYNPNKIQ